MGTDYVVLGQSNSLVSKKTFNNEHLLAILSKYDKIQIMQVDYFNVLSFVLIKSKENTFRKSNCTFLHEHSYFTSTKLQLNHK